LKGTKLELTESNGAWYVLINFDNYKDKMENLGIKNSNQLSKYLIKNLKIIMVAGENFGIEEHLILRYSYIDLKDIDIEEMTYNIDNIGMLLMVLKGWLKEIDA